MESDKPEDQSAPQEEHYDVAEGPSRASKPFWNVYTCCGCLALVFVLVVVGIVATISYGVARFFPATPADFEKISFEQSELDAAQEKFARIEQGEEVAVTPRELEVVWQNFMDQRSQGIEDTKVRVDLTPEGHCRFRFSAMMQGGGFLDGRYTNLEVEISGAVEDGDARRLSFEKFTAGGFNIPDMYLEQVKQSMRQQANVNTDAIRTFRIEGDQIVLKLDAGSTTEAESDNAESDNEGATKTENSEKDEPK